MTFDHERLLHRYRTMMVTIGILYPLWRFMAYYVSPNANESWEQRGMIGVFFLGFALSTYWVPYFRRNVATYFNIITYIWFAQVFYLMVVNNMSFDYLILGLVVIFTAGASFLDADAMLGYYLVCILMTGSSVILKPDAHRLTFFWGVLTALAVSYVGLRSLLGLLRELRKSKADLQRRTDEFTALSSAVQTLFLPSKNDLQTERWHISGFYRPVDGCGGDWWAYSETNDRLAVVVGDVTGHGPGPAMLTASISSYMRALQNEKPEMDLPNLLRALNRHLMELQIAEPVSKHYLMTVQALEIDFKALKVTSWSAGAPPVAIFSTEGEMRILGNAGSPLGIDNDLQLGTDSCPFNHGDRIILYTDGISETNVDRRQIGERKILKFAASDLKLSPPQATRALIKRVDDLRGKGIQDDDYTLVILDVA